MAKDDSRDLGAAAFGLGYGVYLFYKGFRQLRLKRLIEALATSKTRSLAMGLVELSGRAEIMRPLEDPIYGKPCAHYQLAVQEYRKSGKNSRWVTIHQRDSASTPFYLVDDTGRVPVFPAGATSNLRQDLKAERGTAGAFFSSLDPDVGRYLANVPESRGGPLRLTAMIVREGDPVFVIGGAVPADDPLTFTEKVVRLAPASLSEAARRLKADAKRMASLDLNNDGLLDPAEWDFGLKRYHEELARAAPAAAAQAPQALVRATPEGFLYLSDKPEHECLSELGWSAFACVFGGPVLAVACAGYLAWRLKLIGY